MRLRIEVLLSISVYYNGSGTVSVSNLSENLEVFSNAVRLAKSERR